MVFDTTTATATSSTVWSHWTGMDSGTTSATCGQVWRVWNTSATGTATTTSMTLDRQTVWTNWVAADSTITISATAPADQTAIWTGWTNANVYTRHANAPVRTRFEVGETEEERARRLVREQQRREQMERDRAARALAIEKADKLLLSVLDDMQKEQLKQHDWFLVRGQNGKIYRIRRGKSANVDVLDSNGKPIETLCAYPRDNVPDGDAMVAQKLMLECEEKDFLRVAIKHAARGPVVPREVLRRLVH